ncbi:MAG: YggS family pyridoxal phosphate-dependent enzyme [Bacteroidota bacterium]
MQNNAIAGNFKVIQQRINTAAHHSQESGEILLVSVSKTQPAEILEAAFKTGITVFGENYAQELREKAEYFLKTFEDQPQPEWHFIGHLQTNKVKYVVPYTTMIHSVDSLKVAQEISKQALKANKTIQILVQVNTSGELSKSGCQPEEVIQLAEELLKLPNIFPAGLMTIPANDDDISAHREFSMLRDIRNDLQEKFGNKFFYHLSMGMTHDFEIAIEEGATIVRIGTAIFGERNFKM